MVQVYFAAGAALWDEYRESLIAAFAAAGLAVDLRDRCDDPGAVDYIIYAPSSPLQDFTPFTGCKAVLSLWAGVERIVGNATLTQPLCRMVDPALTEGMVEWVVGHVLRHHLGMDRHIVNPGHVWDNTCPPLARERPVTVLGTGALGAACGAALRALNFPVTMWGRTERAGALHGEAGLRQALSGAEIVAIIDDDALLAALDAGQVGHATLDVFREEPLPPDHPFWAHARVTVTPHIAADTRAPSAARVIAENVRRGEAGEPFLHLVDRARGY
jgi:glyoxylate/hydroxypyruvate reductase